MSAVPANISFRPLTAKRWPDLEKLFGERGACGGCWCMWWRLVASEFNRQKGPLNKKAFKKIVHSGEAPGILAYAGRHAVGWCSVAPRESLPRLERSRTLQQIDEEPVWSVVCFFVAKPFRRAGLSVRLLEAAASHVRRRGGKILEGYPVDPRGAHSPDVFVYTGLASAFRRAGFVEVARRSPTRPVMRYTVKT